jgi:hypothetical protein
VLLRPSEFDGFSVARKLVRDGSSGNVWATGSGVGDQTVPDNGCETVVDAATVTRVSASYADPALRFTMTSLSFPMP